MLLNFFPQNAEYFHKNWVGHVIELTQTQTQHNTVKASINLTICDELFYG